MPEKVYDHDKDFARRYRELIFNQYPPERREDGKKNRGKRAARTEPISEANREILIDFFDLLASEGISDSRKVKYVDMFKNIIPWLSKDLDKLTIDDLIKLAAVINQQGYTEHTRRVYLIAVKKLYKTITTRPKYKSLDPLYIWLYDHRTKQYSTNLDKKKLKNKEEWFTEDDFIKILARTKTLRDRCLFAILGSQGCRPAEALTIRRQDITPIDEGLKIKISGKTGSRDLFIYENYVLEAVTKYLDSLPSDQEFIFDIGISRANTILKELCNEAGINKRAYLYKLRKYSVSKDRILGLSNAACEAKYGWEKGTAVIGTYDKSTGKDYQDELKLRYGLLKQEGPKSNQVDRICLRCHTPNGYDNKFCRICALSLDMSKEEFELQKSKDALAGELQELRDKNKKYEERINKLEIGFTRLYETKVKGKHN